MIEILLLVLICSVCYFIYSKYNTTSLSKCLQETERVLRSYRENFELNPNLIYDQEFYGLELLEKLKQYINSVTDYLYISPMTNNLVNDIKNDNYKVFKDKSPYAGNDPLNICYRLIFDKINYNNVGKDTVVYEGYTSDTNKYLDFPSNIYNLAYPKIVNFVLKSSFWEFDQHPIGIYINQQKSMGKWDNGELCVIASVEFIMIQIRHLKKAYLLKNLKNQKIYRYKELLITVQTNKDNKYSFIIVDYPVIRFINVTETINSGHIIDEDGKLTNRTFDIYLGSKEYYYKTDEFLGNNMEKISNKYDLTFADNILHVNGEPLIYYEIDALIHNNGTDTFLMDDHKQLVNVKNKKRIY